jgi:cell division protein FtsW
MFIAIGMMVIYFLHKVNYKVYSHVARLLFLLSIPLLVYTLFFGVSLNEGSRWIRLPIIQMTVQTSDLAKLALFMYMSRLLSRRQDTIKDFKKGFLPIILPVGIICLLIAPANLSTALLIGATSLLLLFIGRVRIKHLMMVVGIALVPILILVMVAVFNHTSNGREIVKPPVEHRGGIMGRVLVRVGTWINRVENFMYGSKEIDDDDNYQVNQAKIAIANGGWMGLGPGNSRQRNFLPHPYSDFIFAIIIEEYGLIGGLFITFIYLIFLYRSIRIFRKCPYAFGAFLALALSFTLVIQALANMAVNVNLFPVTGVTLPLVSMGGSSFIFTCIAIGIILSVARNVEQLEGNAQPAVAEKEEADE